MKEKTCCFTGHRTIPTAQYSSICEKLTLKVEELIKQGYLYFCAGGALGFDTLAALTVLKLKKKYPCIRLILVLPCLNQTTGWTRTEKNKYEDIKKHADKIIYISNVYTPQCMYIRNRFLVDNSNLCICYHTGKKGGTLYTINYAEKKNVNVINIAD